MRRRVELNKLLKMGYLSAEKKQELFGKYGKSNTDTGSPESQIALFSFRINHLTEHLRSNKHDFGTQRALLGRQAPPVAGVFERGRYRALPSNHQDAQSP
jgi:hypothetical protein